MEMESIELLFNPIELRIRKNSHFLIERKKMNEFVIFYSIAGWMEQKDNERPIIPRLQISKF